MAKVMRNPNSTASGRTVLGQISRTTMENVDSPRARATSTNSRVATFIPSAREMRTTRGIVMKPMVPIRTGSEEPSAAITISASRMGGKARNRSREPGDRIVEPAAKFGCAVPERHAGEEAEHSRGEGDAEGQMRTPEKPREHVASDGVAAQRADIAAGGREGLDRDELRRPVGSEPSPEQGDEHVHRNDGYAYPRKQRDLGSGSTSAFGAAASLRFARGSAHFPYLSRGLETIAMTSAMMLRLM